MELAALALPTHPTPLTRIPPALAMQQQEAIVAVDAAVQSIQSGDSLRRHNEQFIIRRHAGLVWSWPHFRSAAVSRPRRRPASHE